MPVRLNSEELSRNLLSFLERVGPASAPDCARFLGISQPAFSRLAAQLARRLLITGKARSTRYSARREIQRVGTELPVYLLSAEGEARLAGTLHAIRPKGFYLQPAAQGSPFTARFYDDLPYWLEDLRPAGFLGRLIPRRYPELEAPDDILKWTGDQCLRYLALHGWDLIGNLIVGDSAFQLYLAKENPHAIPDLERPRRYAEIARDVLEHGEGGSSAAGEQPKFLTWIGPRQTAVLVKFSSPLDETPGRRWADLLVCEHLAHQVIAEHGRATGLSATRSNLVSTHERIFLEVERFDRVPGAGRRGLISLRALDLEFVGGMGSWSASVASLIREGRLDAALAERVRWAELFGELIANSDMHPGNLSFLCEGEEIKGLAPIYDMLPMAYAPRHNQVTDTNFQPRPPRPSDANIWEGVRQAAIDFWNRAARHELISENFQQVASRNAERLQGLAALGRRLPRS